MKTVYLAGPISGLGYGAAVNWRETMVADFAKVGIKGLSPMRCKEYLSGMADLEANCREYGEINVLSSPLGITTRDRFDCTRCDVLFVNLLGADRVSIGTMMELAWADLVRTPIVCAMEPTGNVHDHAMVNSVINFKVGSLDEASDIIKAILL